MGEVFITLKIMPSSPSVDMAQLRGNVEKKAQEIGARVRDVKEEPIAFGIKALIIIISWKEEADPDIIEAELVKVTDVNSVQMTDIRRAIA
jgi:elongation factor 1-beta